MFSLIDSKTGCVSDVFKPLIGRKSGQQMLSFLARHVESGLGDE